MEERAASFLAQEKRWAALHLPRYEELPVIELYMDQLTGYVNQVLAPLRGSGEDDLWLTRAMVNNYVKQGVIEPPYKRRYGRRQLAMLLSLCCLKLVFSIPECLGLVRLAGGAHREGYDRFCGALEGALAHGAEQEPGSPRPQGDLYGRAAALVAGKLYLQRYLEQDAAERILARSGRARLAPPESKRP